MGPGFFQTLRIPLLAGRGFTWRDSSEGTRAVIVSKALAHRLWPTGIPPLGRHLRLTEEKGADAWLTVVGVVGDIEHDELRSETHDPDIFLPFQAGAVAKASVLVRAKGDPGSVFRSVQGAIRRVHRDIPVYNEATLADRLAEKSSDLRAAALVFRCFALLALLIAGSGIYGVLADSVRRRKREIALRMALGAEPRSIVGLVVRESFRLAVAGIGVGWGLSLASYKLIANLLYGVGETDLRTHLATIGGLLLLAAAASLLPAGIAARIRPVSVLRGE